MKVKALVFSIFLLIFVSLSAQETEKKFVYSNITETGFFATSPRYFAFEVTSAHGFTMDKKHHFGIGIGFGYSEHSSYSSLASYIPLFFNYRLYFKPDRNFSPCINATVGGLLTDEYTGGFYSSFTMGFKTGIFSFCTSISNEKLIGVPPSLI